MRLHLLMTGNELMSGVTVDSNSAMIAQKIEILNHRIAGKVTVGDDMQVLVREMDRLAGISDVLIVNGGLGPTQDDLTAAALAKVAGVPLVQNAEAMAHLEDWCGRRSFALNEANRKQAILPEGCAIIANSNGSAVGFRLTFRGCEILCTPGVPGEIRLMLDQEIIPFLRERFPSNEQVVISRFQTFGIGESSMQQQIAEEYPDWPAHIELGFRAGAPLLELKISSFHAEHDDDRRACERRAIAMFGDYIIGVGETNLQRRVVELLAAQGKLLVTAESCTGGLIASMITEVPGASAVYEAGYVCYSDRIKQSALGVSARTLEEHGAVSEAVVREMALGALERSGAHITVAVSGIAGPDGGTPDKPVGTVWVAWGSADSLRAQQLYYPVARKYFQTLVAAVGLDLVRREILGITEAPRFFRERQLRR